RPRGGRLGAPGRPSGRAGGRPWRVVCGPPGGPPRRFNGGEAADLIIIDSKALDGLIGAGKIVGGRTDVARTGIGICVRKGAPRPDVSSAEALKRALLAAKSIAHTAPAGGGLPPPPLLRPFATRGLPPARVPQR